MPIQQGPLRGKKWIVGSSNHGCWLGSYEHDKQIAFQNALGLGHVVYDIGAHVGFYTLLASTGVGTVGRVYSFEPLPRNLAYLRRHIALNHAENCEVIDTAAAATNGSTRFDSSRPPSMGWLSEDGNLEVKTVSIDSLAERQILSPNIMKIDVEGAELAVLQGGVQTIDECRPIIFLATHGPKSRQDCLRFLRTRDYKLESLTRESIYSTDELLARP
ncbi:MAG: FkbM family methyltransferase [Candidatus Acidiferrales bacterium]